MSRELYVGFGALDCRSLIGAQPYEPMSFTDVDLLKKEKLSENFSDVGHH